MGKIINTAKIYKPAVGSGGGGASPAGIDGNIQFNNAGAFGASNNLHWDKINNRLSVGMGLSPAARVDILSQGNLSTDIAFRIRNSSNTDNIIDVRGNGIINLLPAINNPAINIRSNVNPSIYIIDDNGIGSVIAHRYQYNLLHGSNLLSQSLNICSYGVFGGSLGVAKINNFINTYNWGGAFQAQKEGGWYLYFKYNNNFEAISDSDRAFWITPDKRVFVYNNTGDNITSYVDAFQMYSSDISPGNAAPHFRTEAGDIVRLYQETTSVGSAAFVANTGTAVNSNSTFGGYTIGQVVQALKNFGLLT